MNMNKPVVTVFLVSLYVCFSLSSTEDLFAQQRGTISVLQDGFILNNTAGAIQLASTLTDPKIQNISTIVTLTNADKSEKYSNDIRSDLDLSAILPVSLPGLALNGTSGPQPPLSSLDTNENQEETSSDDPGSNSDDE